MDDCLRCHASHFDGAVRDLVAPVDTSGPWKLVRQPGDSLRPDLPLGPPRREPLKGHVRKAVISRKEIGRAIAAIRRTQSGIAVGMLPVPEVLDRGACRIRMSPDKRQALCYQCHAPWTASLVGIGDDAGRRWASTRDSCLACHDPHRGSTRASSLPPEDVELQPRSGDDGHDLFRRIETRQW